MLHTLNERLLLSFDAPRWWLSRLERLQHMRKVLIKGAWPQIQVKFHMPFLILTVHYHGISNGHTE
jgi:hypothetical protein